MTKDQALKHALEKFEYMNHIDSIFYGEFDFQINAIKKALAQQAETIGASEETQRFAIQVEKLLCEKLGRKWSPSGISIQTLVDELADRQAQQAEPDYYGLTKDHLWMSITKDHYDGLKPEFRMACYTSPPPRQWVGLTDEEIETVWDSGVRAFHLLARELETKLKEKNT